jgi:hypothetical protein
MQYRGQVDPFCVEMRYTFDAEANDCEKAVDLRVQTVEWSDDADWDVPTRISQPRSNNPAVVAAVVFVSAYPLLRLYIGCIL